MTVCDGDYIATIGPVIGEGKANRVFKVKNGVIRVSKRGVPPEEIRRYGQSSLIAAYLPQTWVVDTSLGPALFMEHVGYSGLVCEFKPKWLLQSPDAPAQARQCRTCAIKALRGQIQPWCPLQLGQKTDLEAIFVAMGVTCASKVAELLMSDSLLDLLLELQNVGSVFDPITPRFLDAMSARDCTIMIEAMPLRARVVDFDPKSKDKVPKWQQIERDLVPYYLLAGQTCLLSK